MAKSSKSKTWPERKNIFYSAIVDAYIDSSMEKDRSLLYLCSGGIGLLITLITTVGIQSTWVFALYIISNVVFGLAIVNILNVFQLNKAYLTKLKSNLEANENDQKYDLSEDEKKLKKLDNTIYNLFILGILLLFSIGLSTAINQLTSKEKICMSDKKTTIKTNESLQDLSKLYPNTGDAIKSVQGLANMQPKPDSSKTPSKPSNDSGKEKK